MSTTGVESASRRKISSLGHQMRVGWPARNLAGLLAQRLRPKLLPEVLIEFCSHSALSHARFDS
jgi:hypothetical protein